jgi:hypothetical protein
MFFILSWWFYGLFDQYSLVFLVQDISDPEPARYPVIEHFNTEDIAWRMARRTILDPIEHR